MSLNELKYIAILAGSIPVGICMKQTGKLAREIGASLIGFSLVAATCGLHSMHSVLCILVTWAIIRFCTKHCYTLTLAWMFSYLLFFRMLSLFHIASPSPFANAVQLLLTLKMVSLAAELNPLYLEALRKVPENRAPAEKHLLTEVMPRLRDVVSYSYCYLGIMTGPFYRYKTYQDWLQEGRLRDIPSFVPMVWCLRLVPLYGAAFLLLSGAFPLEYTRTAAFARAGFPYRLAYTAAIFLVFRLRFYVAWTLAEASCIAAGFGAYPVAAQSRPGNGPTSQADPASDAQGYDYETIRNIDPYNTDFCTSVKDGMKYWNMTVQWWLANYIYRRAPVQGRLLRIGWTMLVSAFWHGLHPGYYLSFLTIPLCVAAEGAMERGVRSRLGARVRLGYDWLHWFWKMRAYDYMCAGFVLLNLPDTLSYWQGLYFYQHLLALALVALGYLCTTRPPSPAHPPSPTRTPAPFRLPSLPPDVQQRASRADEPEAEAEEGSEARLGSRGGEDGSGPDCGPEGGRRGEIPSERVPRKRGGGKIPSTVVQREGGGDFPSERVPRERGGGKIPSTGVQRKGGGDFPTQGVPRERGGG